MELRFSVRGFGCALFYMPTGGNMNKNQKKLIDATDVELIPGAPIMCLGNGTQGFACCCDECDYFLLCFPELAPKHEEENFAENKNLHL